MIFLSGLNSQAIGPTPGAITRHRIRNQDRLVALGQKAGAAGEGLASPNVLPLALPPIAGLQTGDALLWPSPDGRAVGLSVGGEGVMLWVQGTAAPRREA